MNVTSPAFKILEKLPVHQEWQYPLCGSGCKSKALAGLALLKHKQNKTKILAVDDSVAIDSLFLPVGNHSKLLAATL